MEVIALRIDLQYGSRLDRQAIADFDVGQLALPRRKRLIEDIRLTHAEAVIDPHARGNQVGRLGGRYPLRTFGVRHRCHG
jgi:hypothetical protein